VLDTNKSPGIIDSPAVRFLLTVGGWGGEDDVDGANVGGAGVGGAGVGGAGVDVGVGGTCVGAQLKVVVFEFLTVTLGLLSHVGNPVETGTISSCTLVLPPKHPPPKLLRFVRPSRDTEVRFGQSLRKKSPIVNT